MADKSEKLREELLNEKMEVLKGLVRQHSADLIRAGVIRKLAEMKLDDGQLGLFMDALRQELLAEGESPEDVEQAVAATREGMFGLGNGTGTYVDEIVRMAIAEVVPHIVASWANALSVFASRSGGLVWLRLSLIGDDMMPKGDKAGDAAFAEVFDDSPVDAEVVRNVLREIRASLPAGKVLPDEMVDALDLAWSIIVIP